MSELSIYSEQGDITLTKKNDPTTFPHQLSQPISSTAPCIDPGPRFRHHWKQQGQTLLIRLQPTLGNGERHACASLPAHGIGHDLRLLHSPHSGNREQLRISGAYTHKREGIRR